ncbi:hypothetical protein [Acinetobacter gerneri]|jgi:ATP/ADP translocase|uniref:Uncharacterized protein n=2 Tax=Acinetobacter gerneri TaxID=202952 RepID=N8ZED4_9GAMM|nr:hypothetical protein [Acinetobacter gerneri]ENV32094.1 hypothetical protein F960_03479 [Acinetobacter gerneri DSM 14967 = CIP 107464 = MTCC 9824]EPR83603.1 hypothetical protein L289_1972 [Acinetobacter gerneri DSM 14967 = CIP 107464 = MTCC 9824]MCH4243105.1 hypothetical protein [Acinetobacter gerneri]MDQ9009317.1 hypothetical protein [Acinetobacter gerneri]MDQ9013481.1 hypothetical protein [Acinetobacter gerneri]
MAMRPDVRRHSIIIIAFAVIQWAFVQYIINHQLFGLDTYHRILYFCLSAFGGAFLIFGALIYIVIKGNADKQ